MWPFGPSVPSKNSSSATDTNVKSQSTASTDTTNDPGLDEFLRAIQKDSAVEPTPEPQITAPSAAVGGFVPPITKPKLETLPDGRRVYEDGTIDITEDEMRPRSMNCRQAFDQAFYCQSLGGKFNDMYRYGEIKSCSQQWSAFWWCMSTRTLGDGEKARQTMEHYQKRDAKRKAEHGSSEDIWEIRTRSVREAFGKDPDKVDTKMAAQS